MTPNAAHIDKLRIICLGLTGLACLTYAVLAIWQDRPDPIFWWVPGAFGGLSALLILAIGLVAGRRETEASMDELYRATTRRAAAQAYWIALALFVPLVVLGKAGHLSMNTAMAVQGVLMGAAFPLLFAFHSVRQR